MKLTRTQIIIGAIAGAAAAVVGYLAINGIIDATTAAALSTAIAAIAGVASPKAE